MKEGSIVRNNLMTDNGYSPYCGKYHCSKGMPRTSWSKAKDQFSCSCGWISAFPSDFIERYKKQWNK